MPNAECSATPPIRQLLPHKNIIQNHNFTIKITIITFHFLNGWQNLPKTASLRPLPALMPTNTHAMAQRKKAPADGFKDAN
ncbi:MAG: hypothetical protein PHU14_16375 [Methylovulum sp.]|nr:hypothetical protein [Methylovulum sp.]